MKLDELWMVYEADKRILGFSPHTLKAYSLQLKMLIREIGNLERPIQKEQQRAAACSFRIFRLDAEFIF